MGTQSSNCLYVRVKYREGQSRTQSNACSRVRLALAVGKRNENCNLIGLAEIS